MMTQHDKPPFFIWKNEYSSGNTTVDDQHKHLFKLGNDLFYADYDSGRHYIMEFYKYTRYHFESEEKLMEECSYPAIDAHKKIHEQLIADLNDIADNYFNNAEQFDQFKQFVYRWLTHHIISEDLEIFRHSSPDGDLNN